MTRTGTTPVEFRDLESQNLEKEFREAVKDGLSGDQKTLPPKFFYDHRGSELFEEICNLEEYYQTETERSILSSNAEDILRKTGDRISIVEFGSGSSRKTRTLLREGLRRQETLEYVPIDISGEFLRESAEKLTEEFGNSLKITALAATYRTAMDHLPESDLPRLFVYMGGNIGNFPMEEIRELLTRTASAMTEKDRLLIGIDLVKDPEVIEAAYNDREGITAAFNKNILRRINRELDGEFHLDQFEHNAPYLRDQQKVEMRLVSLKEQTVPVHALDMSFHFEQGEHIHTENSQKFTRDSFRSLCNDVGLTFETWYTDPDQLFAVTFSSKKSSG